MPDEALAMSILDAAWNGGVRSIDTARGYGDAEARIGRWMAARGTDPFVVTKIPRIDDGGGVAAVRTALRGSRDALRCTFIDGLLLHRATDLARAGVADVLGELVASGEIGGFGVSAYSPEDVEMALGLAGISLIQAPFNLLDQRLETSGMLSRCVDAGVTVFARSVFLQGLFTLEPDRLPDGLAEARVPLRKLQELARDGGYSLVEAALLAVRDTPGINSLVIGAETDAQVEGFLAMSALPEMDADLRAALFEVAVSVPEHVIHPGKWA